MGEPRIPDISASPAMWDASGELEIKIDYSGGTNPIYVAWAIPGTATSVAKWKIIKLTWDGNDNPTALQHANDAPGFNYEYDERATYF